MSKPQKNRSVATCNPARVDTATGARARCPRSLIGAGFSLVELLAVIAIIMLLVAVVVPNYGRWMTSAAQARCMGNLRSLHVGLGSYLNDHGDIWPQGPQPTAGAQWSEFWIRTLEPFGITPKTWQCPAIVAMLRAPGNSQRLNEASIHYMPTMFDARPGTARRWPTQPWLIERADAHGNGALIAFTDGSIKPFNKVLAEQGVR